MSGRVIRVIAGLLMLAATVAGCGIFGDVGHGTIPEPTPWPSGTPLRIANESFSSPVGREYSTDAVVGLQTLPGATCSIDAHYHGSTASIPGLGPKTADAKGFVAWNWKISTTDPLGSAPFTVTCSLGNKTVTWSDAMDVRQAVSPAPN